jgi:hypothetical protein
MMPSAMIQDGQQLLIGAGGQDWLTSWHLPPTAPTGKPHGAAGICITASSGIVMISPDGIQWDLPAGRWQPRYGHCQRFHSIDGQYIWRCDEFGALYAPLTLLDQRFVHRTIWFIPPTASCRTPTNPHRHRSFIVCNRTDSTDAIGIRWPVKDLLRSSSLRPLAS